MAETKTLKDKVYEYALNPNKNKRFSTADLKLKRNNTEYILSEIFPIAEDGRFYTQGIELWGCILSELKPYIEINDKKTLDIILSEKMFSKPGLLNSFLEVFKNEIRDFLLIGETVIMLEQIPNNKRFPYLFIDEYTQIFKNNNKEKEINIYTDILCSLINTINEKDGYFFTYLNQNKLLFKLLVGNSPSPEKIKSYEKINNLIENKNDNYSSNNFVILRPLSLDSKDCFAMDLVEFLRVVLLKNPSYVTNLSLDEEIINYLKKHANDELKNFKTHKDICEQISKLTGKEIAKHSRNLDNQHKQIENLNETIESSIYNANNTSDPKIKQEYLEQKKMAEFQKSNLSEKNKMSQITLGNVYSWSTTFEGLEIHMAIKNNTENDTVIPQKRNRL